MSSAEFLREFISQRLSAAAEEIFTVCRNTIIQYEEEIDRQHRLLDIFRKPQVKLHRIDLPQQHVYKEGEVLTDQQPSYQERNSNLCQEEAEPPQIKEEQEELCISQEKGQLGLKQEIKTFVVTPIHEERNHKKRHTDHLQVQVSKKKDDVLQQFCDKEGNAGPDQEEPEPPQFKEESDHNELEPNLTIYTVERPYPCHICRRGFEYAAHLKDHMRKHTSEKPYSCETCGKKFSKRHSLVLHMRLHTGERPYSCQTCGRSFAQTSHLIQHFRGHTGERPYCCNTCDKTFLCMSHLNIHKRIHTGEMPYSCETCRKNFRYRSTLASHMRMHTRTHTVEKPYSCKTCGRMFSQRGHLYNHMKIHPQ